MKKMRKTLAVFKKELRRFFSDKRMLMALILPGLLVFLIYYFLPDLYATSLSPNLSEDYVANIAISDNYDENNEQSSLLEGAILSVFENLDYASPNIVEFALEEESQIKDKLVKKEIDLMVVFDDNFEHIIFNEISVSKPNIDILYNSSSGESAYIYSLVLSISEQLYQSFTINYQINPDVGEQNYAIMQVVAIILPMLTISMIFSSTLQVCPEAIAGEKERGTLSSILVTPIKRSEFALGKILALILVSLVSGTITGAGLLISLPRLYGSMGSFSMPPSSYILLFLVLLTLVVFFVNVAMCISTFAKSIKEATSYLGPLLVVFMVIAMLPGFIDVSNIGFAFVPILNVSYVMSSIVYGTVDIMYLAFALFSNIIFSLIFIFIDVKLFKSESVVMRQ